MVRRLSLKQEYLYIPIKAGATEKCVEFFVENGESREKVLELLIPVAEQEGDSYSYDYYAHIPMKHLLHHRPAENSTLLLQGEVSKLFLDSIRNEAADRSGKEKSSQCPTIHFTAHAGWINDPNGLIYADGVYHLYFQYNPLNTAWNNMSWGHAISRDLLHWEQRDTVLLPDKEGTIFSGCGIVNERGLLGLPKDALVFFYTAAGNTNQWSSGKQFTQRIAYSVDGGETLSKRETPYVDTICKENRDPKVYWHEESNAYIMALWLEENDFAILRSTDLEHWKQSCRFTLQGAWECPDLVKLYDANGNGQWMFWSADGFYFFGVFDGYTFRTDGVRREAYFNKIPYAAQTYFGTKNRTISIPWLRLPNDGRFFTGAMGLPQEFTYQVCEKGERRLLQRPVREFFERAVFQGRTKNFQTAKGTAVYLRLNCENTDFTIDVNDSKLNYMSESGILCVNEEQFLIGESVRQLEFLIDDSILEVWVDYGIMTGVCPLKRDTEALLRIQTVSKEEPEVYTII